MVKKMVEFTHLDFENYTRVEHGYLLIPSPDDKYLYLPEIYDRVCSIILFSSKIGSKSDRSAISNKALSEAMTRAALSEFVAVEEYIASYNPAYKGIWFNHKTNADPIFHMLKLLRNYNVHIDTSTLEKEKMRVKVAFGNQEFDVEKHYISNINIESLSKVKDSKFYLSILPKMIAVFNEQQREWGIDCLIIKCALDNMNNLDQMLCNTNL